MLSYEEFKNTFCARFPEVMGPGFEDYELKLLPVVKRGKPLDGFTFCLKYDVASPTAACFYRYGTDAVPDGSLLLPLTNPDVLFWTNDPDESLQMRAELVAYPFPQTLTGYADMTSETILGIDMLSAVYTGQIDIKLSFDGGTTYGETMTFADFLAMDVDELWESCQANLSLHIQFTLHNDASLTRFKISYKN